MKCNMDCFNCPYPDCINDGRQSFTEKMMLAASCVDSAAHRHMKLEPKEQKKRDYYRDHLDYFREYQKRYYREHKEKYAPTDAKRAYRRKYYREHREEEIIRQTLYNQRRKAAANA